MNKAQRKARLKRIKQNQKAQKRASQQQAEVGKTQKTGAPSASEWVDVLKNSAQTESRETNRTHAQQNSTPTESPKTDRVNAQQNSSRPDNQQPESPSQPDPNPDLTALNEKLNTTRQLVNESRELNDRQARSMLVRAAHFLDEIIEDVQERKKSYPPEMKREAQDIIAAELERESWMEAAGVMPQRRPRRGPNPVYTLMKIGMQASALLLRILKVTNPNIAKLAA